MTMAPRWLSAQASRVSLARTLSFTAASLSKQMYTLRPFQVILSRSGSSPDDRLACQQSTPVSPTHAKPSCVAFKLLSSPSVTIRAVCGSDTASQARGGKYTRTGAWLGERYFPATLPFCLGGLSGRTRLSITVPVSSLNGNTNTEPFFRLHVLRFSSVQIRSWRSSV